MENVKGGFHLRAAFDFGLQTIIVKDVKQNISIKTPQQSS
jgi:hypothetical protein